MTHKDLYDDAIALLCDLIRTPSFSGEEGGTACIIEEWLRKKLSSDHSVSTRSIVHRHGNNIWVGNLHFDHTKPTILLCSHHDTVRPNVAWTHDPFDPTIEERACGGNENCADGGKRLYGLGSNDAGASVVSMAAVFRHFHNRNDLKYNLILALVGEEEISGAGGVRSILPMLGLGTTVNESGKGRAKSDATDNPATMDPPAADNAAEMGDAVKLACGVPAMTYTSDFAIVGEPTDMRLAIAEKGLMVLDCVAKGRAGHAARDEGENAIYHAIKDIEWFRDYRFPRKSPMFGEVKMNVTIISAGTGHNVVPAECRFTVDCRVTEQYTNEEVLAIVRQHVTSDVSPRSLHLRSSSIDPLHPVVQAGISLGIATFGSPTTSDQVALTAMPSVKIGPGQSARSHTADEYIELDEIEQGILLYIKLLDKIL